MEDKQLVRKLLQISKKYDIDKYKNININETHAIFEGTPQKHSNDENLLILLPDPFSELKEFYEFSIDSIGNIEELGSISSEDGETVYRVRLWVKKGDLAIKSEPFIIE